MIVTRVLHLAGWTLCYVWFGWKITVVVVLLNIGVNWANATNHDVIRSDIARITR